MFLDQISIWVCTSLCIVVLALRFSIRLASFRRLFIEDYLMLFSLLTLIAVSAVLQRFLGYIYTIISVQNGLIPLGPDFPDQLVLGLRADGVVLILNTIGIWAIKLSFLSFFLGFGRQIRVYLVLWWISLVLVVTCGVAQLGLIPYRCVFGTLWQMTMECSTKSSLIQSYTVNKVSVSIDVVSDAISKGLELHRNEYARVTNIFEITSRWLPNIYHLEDKHKPTTKASSHCNLPSRWLHNRSDYYPRQYFWRSL